MAVLIDGKATAEAVRAEVKTDVDSWVRAGNRAPSLAAVLIGDDAASASYVRGKSRACEASGIRSDTLTYDATVAEAEVLRLIDRLNIDDDVDGILVQLPLPDHIDDRKVIHALAPDKDVDGFHPINVGRVVIGESGFPPATPAGIMELLRRYRIETAGRRAVVLGRSNIVGKPMVNMLLQKGVDATVTVCHSRTQNIEQISRSADILIAAIGRANFVDDSMVKEGAVVIDVGINRVEDVSRPRGYRLVGDVDFGSVEPIASHITPVPGGVGPMTIAMLLRNTVRAAKINAASLV